MERRPAQHERHDNRHYNENTTIITSTPLALPTRLLGMPRIRIAATELNWAFRTENCQL